jgi:hypothetical protein
VKEVLAKKGVADFDTHEYFNKEYWRQRVRMLVNYRKLPLCKYLGSKGSEKTDKLLLSKKKRSSTSSGTPTDSPRDCAWWLHCMLPTTAYGGWSRNRCAVFGKDGIFTAPDLTVKFAVDLRTQRATNQKAASRALTNGIKRMVRVKSTIPLDSFTRPRQGPAQHCTIQRPTVRVCPSKIPLLLVPGASSNITGAAPMIVATRQRRCKGTSRVCVSLSSVQGSYMSNAGA